eukprot:12935749-Alexandrium_andersonii.AAC.1
MADVGGEPSLTPGGAAEGIAAKRAKARELLEELGEADMAEKLKPKEKKEKELTPLQGLRQAEHYLEGCKAAQAAAATRAEKLREQLALAEE